VAETSGSAGGSAGGGADGGVGRGVLAGRVAVVTGVSRRAGIGFAVARELLTAGARVLVQSWTAHDAEQPWGGDPAGMAGVLAALGGTAAEAAHGADKVAHVAADFADAATPAWVIGQAVRRFGHVDVLVANHARSSSLPLAEVTAEELDLAWAVNARASVLLTQAFAAQHDDRRPGGRVVLFTSGQHLAPMSEELPYAISKGAIHQMTLSLADALADRGITVNTVNPGPVDTGWADPDLVRRVGRALPAGRWGTPEDAARLVRWLASDDAAWITGQVINSEGGFRRWAM
jgi:3-oxoacyl-[acyl-carrier protein] reductase